MEWGDIGVLTDRELLADAPIKATLGIKDAQREREGETEIGLAEIPTCYLLDTLEAIGGRVAMHA